MKKKIIIISAVAFLIIILIIILIKRSNSSISYKTETISIGNIKSTVTATGTVNAVTTVLVGSQVSGTIKKLFVDYNSPVKKGQLLAQIDSELFHAQVDQAKANLQLAIANVEKAEAALADAKRTFERNKSLFGRNFIAKSDLDTSETNFQSANAQLKATKAQVEQAKAALRITTTNLQYTNILSPVKGTVISRNVDVGQTVAASFQTPTLFSIANDLTKMQIDTSIDEADIGKIKVGQNVNFTVDAYPESIFNGKVSVVRNAPITVQNVVTYDAVITVSNKEFKLKPGMTANVTIEIESKQGILRIPNAALRFKPSTTISKASVASTEQRGERGARGLNVWILEKNKPLYAKITTGISDGNYTEVTSGDIREGQQVIVDTLSATKKNDPPPGGAGAPRFIR